MEQSKKGKLVERGADVLADVLINLAQYDKNARDVVERLSSNQQDLIKRIKRKISGYGQHYLPALFPLKGGNKIQILTLYFERLPKEGYFHPFLKLFKRYLVTIIEISYRRRKNPSFMKKTKLITQISIIAICIFLFSTKVSGQSSALAVQDTATLEQQFEYIQDKTRIYEDYRAIRNDVYLKMQKNALDSLNTHKLNEQKLRVDLDERNLEINKLNSDLERIREERDEAIRNRDSMKFLGIRMAKPLYNSILWFIILGLAILVALLYILFRRAHAITREVKEKLDSLQDEYESYRKSSREKHEKLVVNHHNELMKLKNR